MTKPSKAQKIANKVLLESGGKKKQGKWDMTGAVKKEKANKK